MAFSKYKDSTNAVVASTARQMAALYSEYQASQLNEKEFLRYGDQILNAEKFAKRIDDHDFMEVIRVKFAEMKEISQVLL